MEANAGPPSICLFWDHPRNRHATSSRHTGRYQTPASGKLPPPPASRRLKRSPHSTDGERRDCVCSGAGEWWCRELWTPLHQPVDRSASRPMCCISGQHWRAATSDRRVRGSRRHHEVEVLDGEVADGLSACLPRLHRASEKSWIQLPLRVFPSASKSLRCFRASVRKVSTSTAWKERCRRSVCRATARVTDSKSVRGFAVVSCVSDRRSRKCVCEMSNISLTVASSKM